MPGMIVRTARESDLHNVAEIHINSFRTAYGHILPRNFLDRLSVEGSLRGWQNTFSNFPNNITVSERHDHGISGFCCAGPVVDLGRNSPYEFEIYGLHVRSEYQRKGIGRKLLRQALNRAVSTEKKYSAIVWTLDQLEISQTFYESEGGEVVNTGQWQVGDLRIPEIAYGWLDLRDKFGL